MNYSMKAIKDLRSTLGAVEHDSPMSYENMKLVIKLLEQSVKFFIHEGVMLHERGYLAESQEFSEFHLPFPVVAIEYRYEQVNVKPDDNLLDPHERIALCVDTSQGGKDVEDFMGGFYSKKDGFLIFSLYPVELYGRKIWNVCYVGSFVPREGGGKDTIMEDGNPVDVLNQKHVPVLTELCGKLLKEHGNQKFSELAHHDMYDEVISAMLFLSIANCSNVTVEQDPTCKVKPSVNAKRIKANKVPFFEYKILTVEQSQKRAKGFSDGSKRKSPREHVRKGHVRKLGERRIWVNACSVGSSAAGVIAKDYRIV